MSKTVTINQMIAELRGFERRVNENAYKVPEEILKKIRQFIILTGTIDKGDLYVSYEIEEIAQGVHHNFLIEPNNPRGRYEGFVEFPRPTYGLEGRYFTQQGIEASNIERIFDEITFDSFA